MTNVACGSGFQVPGLGSGFQGSGPGSTFSNRNREPGTDLKPWNPEPNRGTPGTEPWNLEPEPRNPEPGTRNRGEG
jgi:hypothetical protein